MGYIEQTLGNHEKLLSVARIHWIVQTKGWLGLILPIGLLPFLLLNYEIIPVKWTELLIAGMLIVAFIYFLLIMIPLWALEIGVTDHRLVIKRGWIARSTEEIQLNAIEEINLSQNITGRILGFGNLTIRGTGVDDIILKRISDPVSFRKAIEDASGNR